MHSLPPTDRAADRPVDQPTDSPLKPRPPRSANARLGLILFTIYTSLYSAFVIVSAVATQWMEMTVVRGLNVACVAVLP